MDMCICIYVRILRPCRDESRRYLIYVFNIYHVHVIQRDVDPTKQSWRNINNFGYIYTYFYLIKKQTLYILTVS